MPVHKAMQGEQLVDRVGGAGRWVGKYVDVCVGVSVGVCMGVCMCECGGCAWVSE